MGTGPNLRTRVRRKPHAELGGLADDYAEYRAQGAAMPLEDRELARKQTERSLWNT